MMQLVETIRSTVDRNWKGLHWTCALGSCDKRLFLRSVPQTSVGIRRGQAWFCTVNCFVRATRDRLLTLITEQNIETLHQPRLSLGSILLAKGWLAEDTIREASAKGARAGESLEATLVGMGLIDEGQITAARAAQWGYPVLGKERVMTSQAFALPTEFMRTLEAVPLHQSARAQKILVGFVRRVENSLLHAIEEATGCRAEPCFITPAEFDYRVKHIGRTEACREVHFDSSMTADEAARRVGGLALEVKARQTTFSRCRGHVWMRLSGQRRMVDVLFRYRETSGVRRGDSFEDVAKEARAAG